MSGNYLEALVGYYGQLAYDSTRVMRDMREDLRVGKFRWKRWSGGAMSLWFDAAEGWYSAMLSGAAAPVPTVLLQITTADSGTQAELHIDVRFAAKLSHSALLQLGGTGRIDENHLIIETSKMKDQIDIRLHNLKRTGVAPGLYQGIIHAGQKPLAILLVQVEPEPPPSRPVTSAATKRRPAKRKPTKPRPPRA
ncbi:MAG: hypothetical protein ABI629_25405 [bacterium]